MLQLATEAHRGEAYNQNKPRSNRSHPVRRPANVSMSRDVATGRSFLKFEPWVVFGAVCDICLPWLHSFRSNCMMMPSCVDSLRPS